MTDFIQNVGMVIVTVSILASDVQNKMCYLFMVLSENT